MKFTIRMGLIGVGALALATCGDSNDASDEVVADNVEIPADDALDDIDEEPVMDEEVTPPPPAPVETQTAEEQQEAVRRSVEDEASSAEDVAAQVKAELDAMNAED